MREGRLADTQIRRRLEYLDNERRLECESAYYLAHVSRHLAEIWPDALFIATVRDPLPWLRSIVNQCINNPRETMREEYKALRDLCFGPIPDSYSPQEEILKKHGLHEVEGYLSYWAFHYRTILDSLPRERTLFLKTEAISQSASRIASFAGVSTKSLCHEESHSHKTKCRHGLVDSIDSSYLIPMIYDTCGDASNILQKHVNISLP
jgi:hypothetical protein